MMRSRETNRKISSPAKPDSKFAGAFSGLVAYNL